MLFWYRSEAKTRATTGNVRDSRSSSLKAGGSLLFVSKGADTAMPPGYQLDSYCTERLRVTKYANLPCLSLRLLPCVRSKVREVSALDARFFRPAPPPHDLVNSLSLRVSDFKIELVTL